MADDKDMLEVVLMEKSNIPKPPKPVRVQEGFGANPTKTKKNEKNNSININNINSRPK